MTRWCLPRRLGAGFGVLLLALGCAAWGQRDRLLAYYYVRGLAQADADGRETWAERAAGLGPAAVPVLLGRLRGEEPRACQNVQACLSLLAGRWGGGDVNTLTLARQLAEGFPTFSPAGQLAALELVREIGQLGKGNSVPRALARAAAEMLQHAAQANGGVRSAALDLALAPLGQAQLEEMTQAGRELARACLRDESKANRAQAVRLASASGVGLRSELVALLRDPEPDIRRAVMIVVGPAPDVIATDDLLYWLHDPDPDVRRLCEAALRGRNLRDEHLRMGRLMTDSRPAVRLQVLAYLRDGADVEPGVWLRRLSHDPAPAVRAATVRASAEQPATDLSDRLEQMAQNDPSPTIRQLARYYLTCRKPD